MKKLHHIVCLMLALLGGYMQLHAQPRMYAGFHTGLLTGAQSSLTFQANGGVQVSYWSLGAGFGLEYHNSRAYSPITATATCRLGNGSLYPYLSVTGGYMTGINRNVYNYQDGFTMGIFTGVTRQLNTHLAIFTALGYRYIQLNSRFETFAPEKLIYQLHRCELRIGLTFT